MSVECKTKTTNKGEVTGAMISALNDNNPTSGTPNLDAMSQDELEEFIEDVEDRVDIPKRVRIQLVSYASHKALAMRHRSRGYVRIALKEEATCDHIYGNLPIVYQW